MHLIMIMGSGTKIGITGSTGTGGTGTTGMMGIGIGTGLTGSALVAELGLVLSPTAKRPPAFLLLLLHTRYSCSRSNTFLTLLACFGTVVDDHRQTLARSEEGRTDLL